MQYKIYFRVWFPLHTYFLMGHQVTLDHHRMIRQSKAFHLNAILRHAKIHPIWYRTYHMTRIQIQVDQILFRRIRWIRETTSIINEDDVWKRIKINARVKRVSMNLSQIVQILKPSYLHPLKHQGSLSSDRMIIHYIAGFISYLSWIFFNILLKFK